MKIESIHKHFAIRQSSVNVVSFHAFFTTFSFGQLIYDWYLFLSEYIILI